MLTKKFWITYVCTATMMMGSVFHVVTVGAGQISSGCALYEHSNFQGGNLYFDANQTSASLNSAGWNDKASSVAVSPGCTLEVFQHDNYQGNRQVYTQDVANVGQAWNDQISSIKCTCAYQLYEPCKMYEHNNFGGRFFAVQPNAKIANLGQQQWNDIASSVQVPNGCQLTVWQHVNFAGESENYASGAYASVGSKWNDQISSAACSCAPIACQMYEHPNFQGTVFVLRANTTTTYVGNQFNDRASSVKVNQGCHLEAYQHGDFAGESVTIGQGEYESVGNKWNDVISSAKCICQ